MSYKLNKPDPNFSFTAITGSPRIPPIVNKDHEQKIDYASGKSLESPLIHRANNYSHYSDPSKIFEKSVPRKQNESPYEQTKTHLHPYGTW